MALPHGMQAVQGTVGCSSVRRRDTEPVHTFHAELVANSGKRIVATRINELQRTVRAHGAQQAAVSAEDCPAAFPGAGRCVRLHPDRPSAATSSAP